MPYLVDTNVLLAVYVEPDKKRDDYQKRLAEQEESKVALKQLRSQGEKLYYSEDTLKEAREVIQKKKPELSDQQIEKLLEPITLNKNLTNLDKEIEKKIDKWAEKQAGEITKAEKLSEKEKQELKYSLKEQKQKELQEKIDSEKELAKEKVNSAVTRAEKDGKPQNDVKAIKDAESDIKHVAKVKAYNDTFKENVGVLTNDYNDFKLHGNLTVKRPADIVHGTRPDEIQKVELIKNPYTNQHEYKGTQLYEVTLASGHSAKVAVPTKYDYWTLAKKSYFSLTRSALLSDFR